MFRPNWLMNKFLKYVHVHSFEVRGCSAPVDLVIILDSSTSVGENNYKKMKKFVMDILKNADIDSGNVR